MSFNLRPLSEMKKFVADRNGVDCLAKSKGSQYFLEAFLFQFIMQLFNTEAEILTLGSGPQKGVIEPSLANSSRYQGYRSVPGPTPNRVFFY